MLEPHAIMRAWLPTLVRPRLGPLTTQAIGQYPRRWCPARGKAALDGARAGF